MRLFLAILGMIVSCSICADDIDKQQIINRIQPVGKVRVQEDQNNTSANQKQMTPVQASAAVKKPSGQDTYEHYCIVCHKDGLAGAPKFQNADDWGPRIQGKTVDDLVAIAEKGLNAMPVKGTCNDCTDEELKAAIQYMLPKS